MAFDMKKYLSAYTMDVMTVNAYGINPNSFENPDNPIVVHARKVYGVNISLSLLLGFIALKIA